MTPDRTPQHSKPVEEDRETWLTIMEKMDETWSQLVGQQVELEQKNSALEEAHTLIASVFDSMSDLADRLRYHAAYRALQPRRTGNTGRG